MGVSKSFHAQCLDWLSVEGQLGYAYMDTQPTPRRVSSLKAKIIVVAAANKHTAVISESSHEAATRKGNLVMLYDLNGCKIAGISVGKYWSTAVTSTGDTYMWDGRKGKDKPPLVTRLHGVKRTTKVSVSETHLLIVGFTYYPPYPVSAVDGFENIEPTANGVLGELYEGFMFNDMESGSDKSGLLKENAGEKLVPSLKGLLHSAIC